MSATFTIPTLETDRLTLRAPTAEDFDAYAEFRASERAVHVGGPYRRHQAFDQLCAIVGHWHLRGYGRWLVADKFTGAPLGIVGLFYPDDWPEPEIGWSVFEAGEGRGIAYEAAVATRAYAYDTLGWVRVISCVAPDNARSVALAKRMGCTRESTFQHPELGPLDIYRHLAPKDLT